MVAVFAFAYVMLEGGLWIIERAAGLRPGLLSSMPEVFNVRSGILGTAAGIYALFRLGRFHPAFNSSYAAWLKSTPWSSARPLPLGPIHPVWQDGVVLGALAAVGAWHTSNGWQLPLIVFGFTYLIGLLLLLAFTQTWFPCLLLGFLWPCPLLPAMDGLPRLGIFAAIILVTWFGLRKSLQAFPWERTSSDNPPAVPPGRAKSVLEVQVQIPALSRASVQASNVGWPFQSLSPKPGKVPISISTSAAVGALSGWWIYCLMAGPQMPLPPEALLLIAGMAALIRLAIYCSGLGPSFNLWSRLASGQIIIPGFDQVFVTPVLVVALAIAGGILIRHSGAWSSETTAALVALLNFVLLSGRPTMRQWLLTGQHRYRFPVVRSAMNKQLFVSNS
jgi:hypothetical protein